MENTQSRNGNVGQCEPCDQCYNLVQQAANNHRDDLKELAKLLQNIAGVISMFGSLLYFLNIYRESPTCWWEFWVASQTFGDKN